MDYYDLKNMEWSGEYLCNSMGADLLAKVLREVSTTSLGQKIFIDATLFLFYGFYESMNQNE